MKLQQFLSLKEEDFTSIIALDLSEGSYFDSSIIMAIAVQEIKSNYESNGRQVLFSATLNNFFNCLSKCINLEDLNLSNNGLGDHRYFLVLEPLIAILKKIKLKRLNLSNNRLGRLAFDNCIRESSEEKKSRMYFLIRILTACPYLLHLDLSNNYIINYFRDGMDDDLGLLARYYLGYGYIKTFCNIFSVTCTKLQSLKLDDDTRFDVPIQNYKSLLSSIASLTDLQELSFFLDANNDKHEQFIELSNFLLHNGKKLKYLNIICRNLSYYCDTYTPKDWHILNEVTFHFHSLETINLSHLCKYGLHSETLQRYLSRLLTASPNLQKLLISDENFNDITKEQWHVFCNLFRNYTSRKLKHVEFHKSTSTDKLKDFYNCNVHITNLPANIEAAEFAIRNQNFWAHYYLSSMYILRNKNSNKVLIRLPLEVVTKILEYINPHKDNELNLFSSDKFLFHYKKEIAIKPEQAIEIKDKSKLKMAIL